MNEKYSEIELKITFNTPAFLGNTKQEGQWRTPPFKALLRQWWRVVKVSKGCDNIDKLRSDEAILFGSATDDKGKKSLLRLKFSNWNESKTSLNINSGKITHPEVKFPVEADLYLGFGAVQIKERVKETKKYIVPNEQNTLWIGFPSNYKEELIETIQLIAWFGTIGSRSRNGWGSIRIESAKLNGQNYTFGSEVNKEQLSKYSELYLDLLKGDWPKKIGKDNKGLLIWKTSLQEKYENVVKDLARIKIDYRTHFKFYDGKNTPKPSERHIISYPITNHDIKGMKNPRKPNQLRFKVIRDNNNKYYCLVYHMPCKASSNFFENQSIKKEYQRLEPIVWKEVHSFLDNSNLCKRL